MLAFQSRCRPSLEPYFCGISSFHRCHDLVDFHHQPGHFLSWLDQVSEFLIYHKSCKLNISNPGGCKTWNGWQGWAGGGHHTGQPAAKFGETNIDETTTIFFCCCRGTKWTLSWRRGWASHTLQSHIHRSNLHFFCPSQLIHMFTIWCLFDQLSKDKAVSYPT